MRRDIGRKALGAAQQHPCVLIRSTRSLQQIADVNQPASVVTIEPAQLGLANQQYPAGIVERDDVDFMAYTVRRVVHGAWTDLDRQPADRFVRCVPPDPLSSESFEVRALGSTYVALPGSCRSRRCSTGAPRIAW